MTETMNFFAILPASVRYNPKLTARSILLYALLTSLAAADGEAYASNEYLAKVLCISVPTIKRLLRELSDERYISVRYEYKNDTKEISRRLIRIAELPLLLDMPNTQALYAVIPTHILCNSDLSPQAKLLYAEISAATPKDGYCAKPSSFFATLLHTSEQTIRRWIKELQDADALRVEMEYRGETKEIRRRRIYLAATVDIVEKRTELNANGPTDDVSSISTNKKQVSNTHENEQIRGMLIFEPTSKNKSERDVSQNCPHKHRNNRHGKRKKATEKLRL